MKKILAIIICLLAAFIPTYIAVGSYLSSQNEPVKQSAVDRITIVAPNGETSELTRGEDSGGFIEFMVSLNNSAEKILALPEPLLDNPYYSLTYYSYDKSTTYNYYFSKQSSDAYYVDASGMAYHIAKSDAEAFLKTPYAFCIYENSSAPVMTLDSAKVLSTSAAWQFKGVNGEFFDGKTDNGLNAPLQTYGTPIFGFDIEPDSVYVTMTSGGEVIFDGYYSDLSSHDFDGVTASVHVTATWYDSSERSYRGEIVYDFDLTFKEPPVFFISSNKATIGDIVTISVLNADDADAIKFSSSPEIDFDPVFYSDGKYMRALIPVSTSYIPGTYNISVDYSGHSQTEFTLDVAGRYTASYPYNVEDAVFDSLYTDANISSYNKLFDSFFDNPLKVRKFDGNFITGLPKGTFESADYCDTLTISKNSAAFENPGLYYSCSKVSDVKSVASGTVIYAGSDSLAGNIAAVDHGLGLVSVYKHLGEISVKTGDELERGSIIGKSGRTGLISKKGANITVARVELYVNKVPVDIAPLTEHGVQITE